MTFEAVKQYSANKVLIDTTGSDDEIEDRSFSTNDIGGYYSFNKNGLIKSYSFFTKTDSTYDKTNTEYELVEPDTTTNVASFCSYAEVYDTTGQIKKVFGNPLVYKVTKLVSKDTLSVSLFFFSLNKSYEEVNIRTNNNNSFRLSLANDSVYTNMKKTFFSYNFKGQTDIEIFIETNYINTCTRKKENLRDTISLTQIAAK